MSLWDVIEFYNEFDSSCFVRSSNSSFSSKIFFFDFFISSKNSNCFLKEVGVYLFSENVKIEHSMDSVLISLIKKSHNDLFGLVGSIISKFFFIERFLKSLGSFLM